MTELPFTEGTFKGHIEALNPQGGYEAASVFFKFTWTTGFWFWKKTHTRKLEFFGTGYAWYWPGVHFKETGVSFSFQLAAACKEALAKQEALKQGGLL